MNKPDDYILAIVEFKKDGTEQVHYVFNPFKYEPRDFRVASEDYKMADLLKSAEAPR